MKGNESRIRLNNGEKNPHTLIRPEVREPGTLDEFISVLPEAAAKKKNKNKTNPEK